MDHDPNTTGPGPFTVCLFEYDRAYGGSEEGGWWYETGTPEVTEHMRVFRVEKDASEYAESLQPVSDDLNEGRPDVCSVLSRGRYKFPVCEGMPRAYPETRPSYS